MDTFVGVLIWGTVALYGGLATYGVVLAIIDEVKLWTPS